jgi:hypothetical protein
MANRGYSGLDIGFLIWRSVLARRWTFLSLPNVDWGLVWGNNKPPFPVLDISSLWTGNGFLLIDSNRSQEMAR